MIHIFVDYENIKGVDPAVFELEGATFTLLLGPQNRKFDIATVEQLMAHAAAVELVRLEKAGRNAVDFALAYYLGRKVITDPTAQYYLVSTDTGFDPLIEHLRGRNVRVRRIEDFENLTGTRDAAKTGAGGTRAERVAPTKASTSGNAKKAAAPRAKVIATSDPISRVLDHLRKNAKNRPRSRKTLMRHFSAQALKGIPEEEIEQLVATLEERGHLEFDSKGRISYRVDEAGP